MSEAPTIYRPPVWPRLLVVLALQLPPLGLLLASQATAAFWIAGLFGSVVCCAGTDSGWRWLNRTLLAGAVMWLLLPLLFGIPR